MLPCVGTLPVWKCGNVDVWVRGHVTVGGDVTGGENEVVVLFQPTLITWKARMKR